MRLPTRLISAVLASALGALISATPLPAQDEAKPKPTPEQAASKLPAGTTICAEFTKSLDARKLKAGDPVEARTTLAVLSQGMVVIPEGSKILGHVTQAAERKGKSNRSIVGILFEEVELKGLGDVRLPLTVQAIGERQLTLQSSIPDLGQMTDPNRTPVNLGTRSIPAPQTGPIPIPPSAPGDDMGSRNPILDASSKGAYGFPGVILVESRDPARGSRIISHRGNVKIGDGAEVILRVIPPPSKDLFLP
jgi:hypothetical protein